MSKDDAAAAERLEQEFERLVGLSAQARCALLAEIGAENPDLRAKLEGWLGADSRRGEFMEDPGIEVLANSDDLVGTSVGRYKILHEIGQGGYGTVYLAEQREPVTRRVALKVIKLGMDTRQVIARFEAERQALAMMDHPNIARVLDAGSTEAGRPYFVMELVRGVPLTEYCDKGKLSSRDRLPLFIDVCRAVHHAHQKGVIHRDLKPSNILVTLHDGIPVAKVIDFGIAKATNFRLTEKTLFTNFEQFVGTPAYTSPEQMEMSGLDVDTRSDIYSLGVLLYELLTGTTPLAVDSLKKAAYAEIQRTILEAEPPTPSSRLSTLSNERQIEVASARSDSPEKLRELLRGELDWIVMKALEKDRERRYPSVYALHQDVQHFLADEPVSAAAPGALYRFRKFSRRHKPAMAIAIAILLGSALSAWQAVRATFASHRAQAQTERAEAGEFQARQNLYYADMNLVQSAVESGNIERAVALLQHHLPAPGEADLRHFEWRYFWKQAHRDLFTLLADDDPNDDIKPDPVFDLAISRDGHFLASAARNGVVRLWDLRTRKEVLQFSIPAAKYAWVDISPDGRHLVASGGNGQTGPKLPHVFVWDLARGENIYHFTIDTASPTNPQFVSKSTIAAGGSDGRLWFLHLENGVTESLEAHDSPIIGVDYQPEADRLVTTSADKDIAVWNPESRKLVRRITWEGPEPYGLARISPDRKRLLSMRVYNPNVSILDSESGEQLHEISLVYPNQGSRFSPDGSLIVTSEIEGTIHLFDASTLEELARYHHRGQLYDMILSADGEFVYTAGDNGSITAWPGVPSRNGVLRTESTVVSVQYSPSGQYLAVGAGSGCVQIWDAETEERLFTTPIPTPTVETGAFPFREADVSAFSPDSRQLALGYSTASTESNQSNGSGFGHRIDVWNLERKELVNSLPLGHLLNYLAWAPNGRYLATGTEVTKIWDLQTDQVVFSPTSVGSVYCLAFSPDSGMLAIESVGQTGIEVWNIESQKRIAVLTGHIEPAGDNPSLLFSPDGSLLATGGHDSRVILWNTQSWKMERDLLGQKGPIADLAFSPDGNRLISFSYENRCVLWDVESGRELASFPGFAVGFSPDGDSLAIGGYLLPNGTPNDQRATTVRILRAPTLAEIDLALGRRGQ